jgi:hypothetical protein
MTPGTSTAKALTVLSFGGGQDSTALLYKYVYDPAFRARYVPGDLLVIMSDTGDEHPSTYKHVEEIKRFCKARGIEFVHLTPDLGFHYPSWRSLRGFYNLKKTVGSKAFPKTCTDKLKIQPIYRFLDQWIATRYGLSRATRGKKAIREYAKRSGKIRMLIGIAAGEERRIADPSRDQSKWRRDSVQMIYPLVELGMDRQACQLFIQSIGHTVPYPSNCMLCPFMSLQELLWLHTFYPDDFQDWVRIERNKILANQHMGSRNLGVWGRKLLPEKLEEAKERFGHMTPDELDQYKMSHGHCVMSRY